MLTQWLLLITILGVRVKAQPEMVRVLQLKYTLVHLLSVIR